MKNSDEINNTKNILNYVYDLRDEFDFDNIEDYQLLLFLIYNNYIYNQENTILGNETNLVLKNIVEQYNINNYYSTKYFIQYYNELNNNFNIYNIEDYKKLLFIYSCPDIQVYQKDYIMANICEIIQKIENNKINNNFNIEYKCAKCGIKDWNSQPINLILNLNKNTNNLEYLCPNCYSQNEL